MPTFGGPDPEQQLLEEATTRAKAAYDAFDARRPLQPVVSRGCPVCQEQVVVEDHGHDTLGIGMSPQAAMDLEHAYIEHVSGHDLDEVLGVIVRLRKELAEVSESYAQALHTRVQQAPPQPVQYVQARAQQVLADPGYVPEESRDEREERLRRSREAQEAYDPIKATPRYSDSLEAGVVGIRR